MIPVQWPSHRRPKRPAIRNAASGNAGMSQTSAIIATSSLHLMNLVAVDDRSVAVGEEHHGDRHRRDERRGERILLLEEERVRPIAALLRELDSEDDEDRDRADVDQDLKGGDRFGAEQHEHPGHAKEAERHEERGGGDAIEKHDRGASADDPDGEHGEDDGLDEIESHDAT